MSLEELVLVIDDTDELVLTVLELSLEPAEPPPHAEIPAIAAHKNVI